MTDDVNPNECAPVAALALEDVKEAAAAVATVYWDPANEVTAPAPEDAKVMALPPSEVTMVAADPPIAAKRPR